MAAILEKGHDVDIQPAARVALASKLKILHVCTHVPIDTADQKSSELTFGYE